MRDAVGILALQGGEDVKCPTSTETDPTNGIPNAKMFGILDLSNRNKPRK